MIIDKEFYLNVIIEMRYIKALEYKKITVLQLHDI